MNTKVSVLINKDKSYCMRQTMTAISTIVDATIIATGRIANQRNIALDVEVLTPILQQVIKDNSESIMDEWQEGIDSNLGEAWLRVMVNTQAYELAGKVLERYTQ